MPVALVDGDLVVHDASEAYADMSGKDLPSLLGMPLAVVFANGDEGASARAAAAAGERYHCDAASIGGLPVHLDVDPIEDDEGARALVVLTPAKNGGDTATADDLRAAIRVIKHEINNPLTGALGNINLLLRRSDLDEKTRRRLATAEREIKKVGQIVVRLAELAPSPEHRSEE